MFYIKKELFVLILKSSFPRSFFPPYTIFSFLSSFSFWKKARRWKKVSLTSDEVKFQGVINPSTEHPSWQILDELIQYSACSAAKVPWSNIHVVKYFNTSERISMLKMARSEDFHFGSNMRDSSVLFGNLTAFPVIACHEATTSSFWWE